MGHYWVSCGSRGSMRSDTCPMEHHGVPHGAGKVPNGATWVLPWYEICTHGVPRAIMGSDKYAMVADLGSPIGSEIEPTGPPWGRV